MSTPRIAALALLLSQYSEEQIANIEKTVIRNLPVERKEKVKTHSAKAQVVKAKTGDTVYGISLPEKGTLSATDFMSAMRTAGKRPFPTINMLGESITVVKVGPSKVREDEIKAIAGFMGYDIHASFGEQEMAARAEAGRQIGYAKTNGQTRGEARATLAQALRNGTFVALTSDVDHAGKRLANLQAQETALVDAIIGHDKMADDQARPLPDRELSAGLADLEREKLACVQADLCHLANGGRFISPISGK